ncbi:MAG: iron-sulfur cluster co-chaperone HscB C-terminal domain-containing protein, partial [Saprospiraceae bacterium]
NEAYKTLKDFDKRTKYILDLKGMLQEGKDKLPQDFLMEMMDINEELMELQFEPDMEKTKTLQKEIYSIKENLLSTVKQSLENYNHESETETELNQIKNYYLKSRYIWRIQENLTKFASA